MTLRALVLAVSLSCLATLAAAQPAPPPQNIGVLRPTSSYVQSAIAVAPFALAEGSAPVEFETVPRTIRRDLELSGYFTQPMEPRAIFLQNRADLKKGLQFAEWQKKSIKHYLMGECRMEGGTLAIRAILYDIDSQKLLFDREVRGAPETLRYLAHTISDIVVKHVVGAEGIARTQLVYISDQGGAKEVAAMDADGFNQRMLTHYGKICTTPCWGNNATEVYYTSYHGHRGNIYGQLLSSGKTWEIAAYGGTNHSAQWSQVDKQLVMVLSKDGNSELYTSLRDGSNLLRLTQSKFTEGSPTWSHDGTQIAYTSNEAGGVHLFAMGADGSGKRRITKAGVWNDACAWSPDADRIVFVSRNGGVNDIYTCDSGGNDYRRLTTAQGNNESPAWAPDGRHIAFASDRSGSWQIYMMLDDGQSQMVLTTTGRNSQPDWGPLPPGDVKKP